MTSSSMSGRAERRQRSFDPVSGHSAAVLGYTGDFGGDDWALLTAFEFLEDNLWNERVNARSCDEFF